MTQTPLPNKVVAIICIRPLKKWTKSMIVLILPDFDSENIWLIKNYCLKYILPEKVFVKENKNRKGIAKVFQIYKRLGCKKIKMENKYFLAIQYKQLRESPHDHLCNNFHALEFNQCSGLHFCYFRTHLATLNQLRCSSLLYEELGNPHYTPSLQWVCSLMPCLRSCPRNRREFWIKNSLPWEEPGQFFGSEIFLLCEFPDLG